MSAEPVKVGVTLIFNETIFLTLSRTFRKTGNGSRVDRKKTNKQGILVSDYVPKPISFIRETSPRQETAKVITDPHIHTSYISPYSEDSLKNTKRRLSSLTLGSFVDLSSTKSPSLHVPYDIVDQVVD